MAIRYQFVTALMTSLLLAACGNSNYQSRPGTNEIEIVTDGIRQGRNAEAGDSIAKSTVAVISGRYESICSGTLITKNVVMTAAHCVEEGKAVGIVFSVNATEVKSYRQATAVAVHDDYIDRLSVPHPTEPDKHVIQFNRNDMALVYFKGSLPAGYEPASMADSHGLENGTTTTVAGYGVYNDAPLIVLPGRHIASNLVGSGTGLLRSANVTVLDNAFSETETVLDQSLGTGACQGDSGGPAYVKSGNKLQVWGVASWGKLRTPNGSCLELAVYTKVQPYKEWIKQVIAAFEKR